MENLDKLAVLFEVPRSLHGFDLREAKKEWKKSRGLCSDNISTSQPKEQFSTFSWQLPTQHINHHRNISCNVSEFVRRGTRIFQLPSEFACNKIFHEKFETKQHHVGED